jgi:hypothetical protein
MLLFETPKPQLPTHMAHSSEVYSPRKRTKKLASRYLAILELPKKSARLLGRLTKILVTTGISEHDLIRIGRSARIHA